MVILPFFCLFSLFAWRTSLGVRDHVCLLGGGNGHGFGPISEPALLNVYRFDTTNQHTTHLMSFAYTSIPGATHQTLANYYTIHIGCILRSLHGNWSLGQGEIHLERGTRCLFVSFPGGRITKGGAATSTGIGKGQGGRWGGPGFQRSWLLGLSCLLPFFLLSLDGLLCMISFWFSLPTETPYSTDEMCGLKYWG